MFVVDGSLIFVKLTFLEIMKFCLKFNRKDFFRAFIPEFVKIP